MRSQICKTAGVLIVSFLSFAPAASTNQHKQNQHQKEKTVWNYDGGVFFETDGTLPNGVCFRVSGQMSAPDFFDNLRRMDTEQGTIFRRGSETVTQFPESVDVTFSIRDELCPSGIHQVGTRVYLTQEMMKTLRLSIYWKHGVDLHAVKNIKELNARVDRINPYATALAAELPRRYEWSYELAVQSAGVSLSDSLAFVFRTPDGRIAARVAARL
jgi:hypothetical protein